MNSNRKEGKSVKRKGRIWQKIKKKGRIIRNLTGKRGFGINEIIGVAAGVIIAAVIVVPGLRTFASSVMTKLSTWWDTVAATMFK